MTDKRLVIAFVRIGDPDTIGLIDAAGGGSRELMQDAGAVHWTIGEGHRSGLVWSHDGRRLLIGSSQHGLRSLDSTGFLSSVRHGSYCDPDALSWSPTTTQIACGSGDGITIINQRGVERLFQDRGNGDTSKSEPAWSPDGRSLAYIEGTGGDSSLKIYDFASTTSRLLPSTRGGSLVHAPGWSPDGKWIAFSNHCLTTCTPTIWVVRRDGSGLRRIVRGGMRPAWSADGSRLAFDSNRDGDWEIYVLTLATGRVQQLTHNDLDDISPTWRALN